MKEQQSHEEFPVMVGGAPEGLREAIASSVGQLYMRVKELIPGGHDVTVTLPDVDGIDHVGDMETIRVEPSEEDGRFTVLMKEHKKEVVFTALGAAILGIGATITIKRRQTHKD